MSKKSLEQLFEGVDGVNQQFLEQLTPIFEARVDERLQEKITAINEQHEQELNEVQEKLDEALAFNINESNAQFAKTLDVFLENVVVEWANNNSVAIQEGAMVEASGNFFMHLAEAAKKYNVALPEGDEAEKMEKLEMKNESLRIQLNDAFGKVTSLTESIQSIQRQQIIESASVGMTDFGKQTLAEKCADVDFQNETHFQKLVEGYKHIIESEGEEDEDELEEGKKGLKEGENKLPQTAAELDKQTKKDKKPVLESANPYSGVDLSLFT